MKFDDEICKGVSCPECSFNKGEDGCLLAKRLDEIEIIPEPCEDAISRQAAIDIVDSYSESQSNVEDVTQDIISDISALPPVTSQSKTGHWIPVSEELPDKEGHYLCSVRYMYPPYNFFEPEKVKYMDDVTIQKFDGEFNIEVKAWMPLPKPFETQERSGEG